MLILVHPFGLSSPGGGPRIFRSLLQEAPQPWISVCSSPQAPPASKLGNEVHLPIRRSFGRLEQSRLSKYLYLFEKQGQRKFETQLAELCRKNQATGIHGVAHSMDFWYAYRVAQALQLPYYFTVHDDLGYALQGQLSLAQGMTCLSEVWNGSAARFVISEAMGEEYCRRYGIQSYTIATDGLTESESAPLDRPERSMRVYFMGAVHLTYEENFHALYAALQEFQRTHSDWDVSLTIRGGTGFQFQSSSVPVNLLPWGSEEEVSRDLAQADYLYLPLPFGQECESFVRYSLSTKMVTYLGSGLPVLYHGPAHAAAGRLLSQEQAAIELYSLSSEDLGLALMNAPGKRQQVVYQAIALGRKQFSLKRIRNQFWAEMNQGLVAQS